MPFFSLFTQFSFRIFVATRLRMRYFFCCYLLFSVFICRAQQIQSFSLKSLPIQYRAQGFYIKDVVDYRKDVSKIAYSSGPGGTQTPLYNLQPDAARCIGNYIKNNLTQNASSVAVTLHIQRLEAILTKNGSAWEIKIYTVFGFYFEEKMLTEISVEGGSQASNDPASYIEQFIRETIADDLESFGKFWAQNKGKVATSQTVKVNVTAGQKPIQQGQILYRRGLNLKVSDFLGAPEPNESLAATTFSGIGFNYTTAISNGQIVVNVFVTPYFDKSMSWFKKDGHVADVLAHEQLHFDIRVIGACNLIKAIKSGTFSSSGYQKQLEELRKEFSEKAEQRENEYDVETNHGLIADKQAQWSKQVKMELLAATCF